jgi:hypothetical protein
VIGKLPEKIAQSRLPGEKIYSRPGSFFKHANRFFSFLEYFIPSSLSFSSPAFPRYGKAGEAGRERMRYKNSMGWERQKANSHFQTGRSGKMI